ncbi:MAG: DUF6089 family protein [Salinivirgaceae bacterium]|nr:DUF6089 family protein [Salinivirgaceae bacterium]
MKKYIVALVLLCVSISVYADRWDTRKYELRYGLGLNNFMGDICAPKDPKKQIWIVPFSSTGYVADGMLKYIVKDRHSVSGSLNMGYLTAKDPKNNSNYWYRDGYQFRSFFTELGFRYEYEFVRERRKSTVYRQLGETVFKNITIPSYLFAGAGVEMNYGGFNWNTKDGKERMNEKYFCVAPVIMMGVGAKFRVAHNTYVGGEFGLRFALGDKLDNCSGKDSPQFGKWIDQYQVVTINVIHKLKAKKNNMPNFKSIRVKYL